MPRVARKAGGVNQLLSIFSGAVVEPSFSTLPFLLFSRLCHALALLQRSVPVHSGRMELVQTDPAQPGRRYDLTDAQFSVRAVLDGTGKLTERVRSSAYGVARHGWRGDTDGDGATTLADRSIILGKQGLSIGDAGYSPDCDLDRSGTIDSTDASLWAADGFKAALPAGWLADSNALTSPNGHASPVGYCGYLFNAPTQLYTVRFRHYDPGLGRWLERDPFGYIDGMSRLAYGRSAPLRYTDPLGFECTPPRGRDHPDSWWSLTSNDRDSPGYNLRRRSFGRRMYRNCCFSDIPRRGCAGDRCQPWML